MAWTKNTENLTSGTRVYYEETITLPASATEEYSSEIDFVAPNINFEDRNVLIEASASAVSGTNLDIALYAAPQSGGAKTQVLDAVVADLTSAAPTAGANVDLNTYFGSVYYLGHTADANESANSITYRIAIS